MSTELSPPTIAPQRAISDSHLESGHTALVLRTKFQIALNSVRNLGTHRYIHAAAGIVMMALLLSMGTGLFFFIFRFLMNQPVFGPPLMDRLVGIVFLIFFSMLLFSNLIITLSTSYLSKEVEFLMSLPISRQSIFRQKLIEGIVYSSWAFAVLSLPLFISYGFTRNAEWYFYPLAFLLVVPFLIIPAAIGSIITMLLTSILPARKTRTLCIALGIASIAATILLAKITGISSLLSTAQRQDLLQIMSVLAVGNSPMLPSAWLGNALQAIAPASADELNLRGYFYWFAMLTATALFLLEVTRWLVPSLYYKGWCLSRDAAVREVESNAKFSPFRYIDRKLEGSFAAPTAGLLSKDLKTFWRDPAQWTQLVILVGLMVIYIVNLNFSRSYGRTLALVVDDFRFVLTFFNLSAMAFILSIITTRFIYPLLSLEGRGFWTVGLAPIRRTRVVWQKWILCVILCCSVSIPLVILSNYILQVGGKFSLLAVGLMVVMSIALSSLSIGISAIIPDFKEDNPARIANGLGGTMNVLLSLVYIAVTMFLVMLPTFFLSNQATEAITQRWLPFYTIVFLIVQGLIIYTPLRAGLQRWERMEF